MKSDKNFRLKKSYKTMVALISGTSEIKNHFKGMLIQSQLAEEAARRSALKMKDNSGKTRGAIAPE